MQSDEALMNQYKAGDERAFGLLYEKYSPLVYAFIKKRLRESEAEDLFQKVWRQLHEKRHLYQDQPFAPWLFVMVRHLLIDEYRGLARRSARTAQDELLEKLYAADEKGSELEELLATLPEENRNLVEKYYLEGFSYEELEKETGLSQAGLRQRLSRTIRALRARMQGSEP
jgi:RNA polymerase sigma-70 factor, ECF subfamily